METHILVEVLLSREPKQVDVIVAMQPTVRDNTKKVASVVIIIDGVPTVTLAGYAEDIEHILSHALTSLKETCKGMQEEQKRRFDARN